MYKCKNCGNTEKFIGFAEEKGSALIFQEITKDDKTPAITWIYSVSDGNWGGKAEVLKCFYCNSKEITKV